MGKPVRVSYEWASAIWSDAMGSFEVLYRGTDEEKASALLEDRLLKVAGRDRGQYFLWCGPSDCSQVELVRDLVAMRRHSLAVSS